jgi:superfamily II DNA or RNA helicase
LRKKIGILELATGSGKTECAIECIRRLTCKTLFVTDRKELLNQTKKRIEEALGIKVGVIGQGEIDLQDVSVATIQTLNKRKTELKEYLSKIKFVIMDECHHIPSASYIKLSKYLIGTEFRLGLSATSFRTDGNDMQIQAVCGDILHHINSQYLIERGFLVQPQIFFIKDYMPKDKVTEWENNLQTGLINETKDYNKYYEQFIKNNEYRNNKVVEIINQNKDKKILVLTKLIEHGQLLNQLIPGSSHLFGGTDKEDRKRMFEEFIKSDCKVLVSSIGIFSEGIDIPSINMIINCSANVSDIKSIQILGRGLRNSQNKITTEYYDFIDETRFFRLASLKRMRTLKKEGHEVEVV